jgi:hypothetical protein
MSIADMCPNVWWPLIVDYRCNMKNLESVKWDVCDGAEYAGKRQWALADSRRWHRYR